MTYGKNTEASLDAEPSLVAKLQAWADTCPAATALQQICKEHRVAAYYFGGVCRAVWDGNSPRDLDIVVDDLQWDRLKTYMPQTQTENRFGGIKFQLEGMSVDAWPISQTWAFAQKLSYPSSPTILPETTLLNVESVVALIWHPESPWVFEKGFFAAMKSRKLEIQNEENPYPALCIARIRKFESQGWIAGESVKAFCQHHLANGITEADIQAANSKHYQSP